MQIPIKILVLLYNFQIKFDLILHFSLIRNKLQRNRKSLLVCNMTQSMTWIKSVFHVHSDVILFRKFAVILSVVREWEGQHEYGRVVCDWDKFHRYYWQCYWLIKCMREMRRSPIEYKMCETIHFLSYEFHVNLD